MTDAEVRAALEVAVARLVKEEPGLFTLKVGEPAIAHHLSKYLEQGVRGDLNIDVEYNRHGTEKKVLLLPPSNIPGGESQYTCVRPDIVVHLRGTDASNLLVVEVKKPGQTLDRDKHKLVALREQYQYRNAAHVVVGYYKGKLVSKVIWIDD